VRPSFPAPGRYLVQHSAGSGKTNSIAWTAHFLAELHDDAPTEGGSYPSGHAAIAACAALLTAPYLPRWSIAALVSAVGATTFTRVHQGAHFPLDALGGVLMGVSAGALLCYVFGLPV